MIKDIIKSERPRERLLNAGASSLSNEELLSIILKTGTKNISVKDLSRTLLKEIYDITNLRDITYNKLIKIKGNRQCKSNRTISFFRTWKTSLLYKYKR